MDMPPTSMYGDPHSRAALDTLAAHHAAAQHMNHSSRHEKLHFPAFHNCPRKKSEKSSSGMDSVVFLGEIIIFAPSGFEIKYANLPFTC